MGMYLHNPYVRIWWYDTQGVTASNAICLSLFVYALFKICFLLLVFETVFQLSTFDATKPVLWKIECMSVKCISESCRPSRIWWVEENVKLFTFIFKISKHCPFLITYFMLAVTCVICIWDVTGSGSGQGNGYPTTFLWPLLDC